MATIGDVAKKAGVSTTLVSRYLNQVKGVSPASKEKIEAAIRELNYVPDESARMLVRRRGGAVQGTPISVSPVQNAVALVCEDVDFQLLSALYLGMKHGVWSGEQHRDYHVLLLPVLPGDDRKTDEEETLAFVKQSCKGLVAVGESAAFFSAVVSLGVPALTVTPERGAWTLHRASQQLRESSAMLEEAAEGFFERLYEKIAAGDNTVSAESVGCHFTVIEDESERSPLGRSLQSHLL